MFIFLQQNNLRVASRRVVEATAAAAGASVVVLARAEGRLDLVGGLVQLGVAEVDLLDVLLVLLVLLGLLAHLVAAEGGLDLGGGVRHGGVVGAELRLEFRLAGLRAGGLHAAE
ncbi:unnamed protein product [Plutella xylostella]|uniref:(diamondback moth) hypothetical protein n=1 Tax=Plutella xylostella TaxID=51655 RepID=A0A8S4GDW5_PLUXY|nr:unnamed protein product [Plutella xylostella]